MAAEGAAAGFGTTAGIWTAADAVCAVWGTAEGHGWRGDAEFQSSVPCDEADADAAYEESGGEVGGDLQEGRVGEGLLRC